MLNELDQTPCSVAAYLSSQCTGRPWNVPPLHGDLSYNPPSASTVSECRCSSVDYSLIQACSVCQGGTIDTWANWIFYCPKTMTTTGKYPRSEPPGTRIPAWSLTDPTQTGGSFDVQQAKARAESNPSSHSGGKNTGPIVGGIIGGICAVLLVILMIWFLHRRQRQINVRKTSMEGSTQSLIRAPPAKQASSSSSSHKYAPLRADTNESTHSLPYYPTGPYNPPSYPPTPPSNRTSMTIPQPSPPRSTNQASSHHPSRPRPTSLPLNYPAINPPQHPPTRPIDYPQGNVRSPPYQFRPPQYTPGMPYVTSPPANYPIPPRGQNQPYPHNPNQNKNSFQQPRSSHPNRGYTGVPEL
ncbi:hypothetical protein FRC02_006834 [Tulasnella sp. 418]|nr:hypothetical protein FRC02_006834 [Tulasnella sp. 418]